VQTLNDELAELRALERPALIERFREVFGREPRQKNRVWLIRRLAWRAQERRLGGLSETARKKLESLIAEIDFPIEEARTKTASLRHAKPGAPIVGSTLTREWHGKQVAVRVVENGFEHEGVVHRSLSAVAQAITGSHWNGRLFFGLTNRKATR